MKGQATVKGELYAKSFEECLRDGFGESFGSENVSKNDFRFLKPFLSQ